MPCNFQNSFFTKNTELTLVKLAGLRSSWYRVYLRKRNKIKRPFGFIITLGMPNKNIYENILMTLCHLRITRLIIKLKATQRKTKTVFLSTHTLLTGLPQKCYLLARHFAHCIAGNESHLPLGQGTRHFDVMLSSFVVQGSHSY